MAVGMQIASVSINHTTGKENKKKTKRQKRKICDTKLLDKALLCVNLCERENTHNDTSKAFSSA